MTKTIMVQGTGKLEVIPDYVILILTMDTQGQEYDAVLEQGQHRLNDLNKAVTQLGFSDDTLKTMQYRVSVMQKTQRNEFGDYDEVQDGYKCHHVLNLSFDFRKNNFSKVISGISGCSAAPDMEIKFTVKDAEQAKETLLYNAAANARRKAEILCEASGVKLGSLIRISYDWNEFEIASKTKLYQSEENCFCDMALLLDQINPDAISLQDSAGFVWEII